MGEKIKKIKRIKDIRLHREGTNTLLYTGIAIAMVGALIWYLSGPSILFKAYICLFAILYGIMINFFRCPVRYFNGETSLPLQTARWWSLRKWKKMSIFTTSA